MAEAGWTMMAMAVSFLYSSTYPISKNLEELRGQVDEAFGDMIDELLRKDGQLKQIHEIVDGAS